MKRLTAIFLLALATLCGHAQELTMASLFKTMPDSLLPYLTKNNRLDMIDFMEANMKAEVINQFQGTSEMTLLRADSLSIRLSESLRVDMRLDSLPVAGDSLAPVITVVRTYRLNEKQAESVVDTYSSAWRLLSSEPLSSSLLKRDEELADKPHF